MIARALALTSLLIHQGTLAADAAILVRAAGVSVPEFATEVALRPAARPWSDHWIRHRLKPEAVAELKQLVTQAQMEFLKGDIKRAEALFRQIVALGPSQDWRAEQRAAFAYAALRLAQIATDLETRLTHLREARRWGEVQLESRLFPEPLWRDYTAQLKVLVPQPLDLDTIFPDARYLLVDGRPLALEPGSRFAVDQDRHRFTLVSDHALPETMHGTWEQLKNWRPQLRLLAQGSCQDPILSAELNANAQAFYGAGCWRSAATPKNPVVNLNYRPTPPPSPITLETPISAGEPAPNSSATWLWAAAGAIVVSAALVLSRERRENPAPATSVGF